LEGGGGRERDRERQRESETSQAQEILLYNHNASEGNVIVMQLGNVNAIELGLLGLAAASPVNIKRKLKI
jgi:hypothetical protein